MTYPATSLNELVQRYHAVFIQIHFLQQRFNDKRQQLISSSQFTNGAGNRNVNRQHETVVQQANFSYILARLCTQMQWNQGVNCEKNSIGQWLGLVITTFW